MLQRIVIHNYALIHRVDLTFGSGFSTLTGETGAGKSIMLGALGLVLGNRADIKTLGNPDKKCVVEAVFEIAGYNLKPVFDEFDLDYDNEVCFRREITPAGKSRAFVNDTPVSLPILKELATHLVNIHSQHEVLLLNNRDFQLTVLDTFAGIESDLEQYQGRYNDLRGKQKALQILKKEYDSLNAQHDYDLFLLDELKSANLDNTSVAALESACRIYENGEQIKQQLGLLIDLFDNEPVELLASLKNSADLLHKLEAGEQVDAIASRLKTLWIEADDLGREVAAVAGSIEENPEELAKCRQRLDLVNQLLHKHRVQEVDELIDIRERLSEKLNDFSNTRTEIENLESECAKEGQEIVAVASELSKKREEAVFPLQKHIVSLLAKLGMPHAELLLDISPLPEPGPDGIDRVEFLFTANRGMEPTPIAKVASGGELSRVMLSIKSLLSEKKLIPTIIFDEIDSGVSGEIAGKAGEIMRQMGESMQVIAITHLPQIAAKGGEQFFASKQIENDRTVSSLKKLTQQEREEAIAAMLSDGEPTPEAFANARLLLKSSVR